MTFFFNESWVSRDFVAENFQQLSTLSNEREIFILIAMFKCKNVKWNNKFSISFLNFRWYLNILYDSSLIRASMENFKFKSSRLNVCFVWEIDIIVRHVLRSYIILIFSLLPGDIYWTPISTLFRILRNDDEMKKLKAPFLHMNGNDNNNQ